MFLTWSLPRLIATVGPLAALCGVCWLAFRWIAAERRRRRGAELALEATGSFLDSILEHLPIMISVKDAQEMRWVRVNRALEQTLGVERASLIGKTNRDLFPADVVGDYERADLEVLSSRAAVEVAEERLPLQADCRWIHIKRIPLIDASGTVTHIVSMAEDVTERRQMMEKLKLSQLELEQRVAERTAALVTANAELQSEISERRRTSEALRRSEEQFRQSQKMEAVGRLAGGIAHDFNNMLSVILSYSDMLCMELPEADPTRGDLEEIRRAAERAASLTRQLLAFSRQQLLEPRILDLSEVVLGMRKLLDRVLGEDIDLRTSADPALNPVKLDPGQIEQVILNLAVNARDAMPQGGTLSIEVSNVELEHSDVERLPQLCSGPHVRIQVSDTGSGIDPATQLRIFEPFFTTKDLGKGTGLGLSTVLGIVEQSGGAITFDSLVGKGTCFRLLFPAAVGQTTAAPMATPINGMPRGWETVLLVEDESQVRTLARTILTKSGYQLLEARDAEEALLLCERFSGPIHLMLTDVVMPKWSGRELAERLSKTRPSTQVLFMSGYTDDTVVHHGVLKSGLAFLQKPLTPEALTRRVREVLDGAAPEARPTDLLAAIASQPRPESHPSEGA